MNKILWFSPFCLLDTSSGASRSVREMLYFLSDYAGYQVKIVSAGIFDNQNGFLSLPENVRSSLLDKNEKILRIKDKSLEHIILKTRSTERDELSNREEGDLFNLYRDQLLEFRPNLMWFYGGRLIEVLAAYEARIHGIPVAAYVANGNYTDLRWCQDVDLIITNSQATAQYYKQKVGLSLTAVGKFILPDRVVASSNSRKYVTFINPSLEKGAGIVASVAHILEHKRPEIQFEVVESRGDWSSVVTSITRLKEIHPRETLTNVMLTKNSDDVRKIYGRSRVLFAPSLWYESSARVIPEALLNGIPLVITENGGMPEMAGPAAIKLRLPEQCMRAPYDKIPGESVLVEISRIIERFYDDAAFYDVMMARAYKMSLEHNPLDSLRKLDAAFKKIIVQQTTDDPTVLAKKWHKHF